MHQKPDLYNKLFLFFTFISLWYYYFASTYSLRPFPQLFWIGMAGISIVVALIKNVVIEELDKLFVFSFSFLAVSSVFSVNVQASFLVVCYYLIYYLVAKLITKNVKGKDVIGIILIFSIFHMFCIFLQVLLPEVYKTTILPLLPVSLHDTIIEQMNWNSVYYGFSIQTSMSAMYLSIAAILTSLKVKYTKDKAWKGFYIILVILFLVATFYTQRRGSSLVAIFVIALIYFKSTRNKTGFILTAIIAFFLLSIVGFEKIPGLSGIMSKFSSVKESGSLMNGRDDFFMRAIKAIYSRPFFGFGGGQLEAAIDYAWLENSFLSVLVQWGIVGGVIFFIPYFFIYVNTVNSSWSNSLFGELSFYIQILYLLMSFVENYFGNPINVFLYFVIVGIYECYYREHKGGEENA